jgi:hypothetical protein
MTSSSSLAAVRAFVTLATEGPPPTLDALIQALDSLAAAYHGAPAGRPADDAEPPEGDYAASYATLSDRFPDYGFYATTDPSEPVSDVLAGDAIDDLADIVGDLSDLIWREDVLGADDAHWWLRERFATHWGRHLRDLSVYLHTKRFS